MDNRDKRRANLKKAKRAARQIYRSSYKWHTIWWRIKYFILAIFFKNEYAWFMFNILRYVPRLGYIAGVYDKKENKQLRFLHLLPKFRIFSTRKALTQRLFRAFQILWYGYRDDKKIPVLMSDSKQMHNFYADTKAKDQLEDLLKRISSANYIELDPEQLQCKLDLLKEDETDE